MKKHALRIIPVAIIVILCAGLFGCDNETTTDTAVIKITGKVPIVFNWYDAAPSCPDCKIYAQVYTGERWGTFYYGPFEFDPDSITLDNVLAGQDRDFTVWVTDTSGEITYRDVTKNVQVIANTTNDPVQVTLYPRGWYEVSMQQPSLNWQLTDVKLADEGYSWMAGRDNSNGKGVIFRGAEGAWSLRLPEVTGSSNWTLNSIASGAGGEAWAVGEDIENNQGIILRYDGSLWNDDIKEPPSSCLFGVSFSPSGSIGRAVGEIILGSSYAGVMLAYPSSTVGWVSDPAPAGSVSLFDVATFNNGDAIVGGKDNDNGSGYLALWDDSADSYSAYSTPGSVCSKAEWHVNDIFAVNESDWWAAGACYTPVGSINGVVLHYTSATSVTVEDLSAVAYSDDWWLNGIWADSAGDAWAVGEGSSSVVILNKSGGSWTPVTPDGSSGDWKLSGVDFNPAGSITWGYAVGHDASNSRGLAIKYPFPE